VTAVTSARTIPGDEESCKFAHVLDGAALSGAATHLARALDQGLLDEAGWDPVTRVLYLPAQHRLLGRKVCRVERCVGTVHNDAPEICHRCFTRLTGMGMSVEDIAAAESLPAAPVPAERCAVPQCRCTPTVRDAVMCEPHAQQFRGRRIPISLEQFVSDPRVRPRPPLPACLVPACTRTADGAIGYCTTHYQRWSVDQQEHAELDEQWWRVRESGVAEPGQVNLRALPSLVVVEVLTGLQTRVRDGLRLTDVVLRAVCDTLRRHQVGSIHDCDPGLAPGKRARSVLASFARDARRVLADPGVEQDKDRWDLAIFGTPARCRSPRSPSPGWPGPRSGGLPSNCPSTAAAAPLAFAARSTASGCCPSTCIADPITGLTRPRWAGPTWRDSSTGSAIWSSPARSVATAAT
jgi:hypothetical protein